MAEQTQGLKLFNTLTGQLEAFSPIDPAGKEVKLYVCGPTVYDDAHLGHARCYITWDVLYRFLKFLGYDVKYVRNVTDVDDKILNRAKERGESPAELAERNYQSFTEDMKALNVLPPDEEPRATQYIQSMLDGIQALIEKGAAYPSKDGSVYFRVSAKPDYGKLKFGTQDVEALKKHLEDLKSGARVEVDEEKESPLDFALWKAVPQDDPHGWESPWPAEGAAKGWGRPGWHMECSAMNHAVFGAQIDIHAGGADLIFPHHENEIAQSEAWAGLKGDDEHSRFAKYWLHNGFVNVSGEKMSKSLGNFSTIKKLLERYDANTIRYFLLTNHYRMPVDFSDEALEFAVRTIERIHSAIRNANKILDVQTVGDIIVPLQTVQIWKQQESISDMDSAYFETAISNLGHNLSTAKILEAVNQYRSQLENLYRTWDNEKQDEFHLHTKSTKKEYLQFVFKLMATLLNVTGFSFIFLDEKITLSQEQMQEIRILIQSRKTAKAEKNWAEADRIRNEILAQGYQLLDNKDGTTTVEKDGLEIVRV